MHCIKIVYINSMIIFVINKFGKRKKQFGSVCVSVNFCFPALDWMIKQAGVKR